MAAGAIAALFVVVAWWLSTGVVLRLVWLGRAARRFSVAGASAVGVAALYGLWRAGRVATPAGAYAAFGCALAVWGWHELAFLLGVVTGPRKAPCPAGAAGVRRFAWATAALLYHELGLAATLALVAWLGRGAPNRVGLGTFGVLWVMRLSAKFNVFLGVRNLTEGFVPHGLRYLLSYGRRARWNPLMPASLAGGAAAAAWLGGEALAEGASSFVVVSRTLVTTLLSLAVLEHIFLALPLPDALLWRWAVPNPTAKPVRGMRVEVR